MANGYSILIGCLHRLIICFSHFSGLFLPAAKFPILARKMRHNPRQSDNNTQFLSAGRFQYGGRNSNNVF